MPLILILERIQISSHFELRTLRVFLLWLFYDISIFMYLSYERVNYYSFKMFINYMNMKILLKHQRRYTDNGLSMRFVKFFIIGVSNKERNVVSRVKRRHIKIPNIML